MNRTESNIPFVGLHAHSVAGSPFDALGFPAEHMEFAYQNGMGALALTDHGNANGLSYQVLHAKKMKEEGKDFKPIFGVEAYFVPSLSEWKEKYTEAMAKKKGSGSKHKGESQGTVIEDEERKEADTLKRRRHLILLAQNETGLKNIFKMISQSFAGDNFYRFPRVDYEMLRKHSEGVIAASACLGGIYAGDMWENREEGDEAVLAAMRKTTEQMQSIFGDRWYGELQWSSIPEQHQLNQYIIKVAEEFGVELISTADSHYPSPDAWKDRILYKRLGWLGKGGEIDTDLPNNVEEVGYELYPKNGEQMFETYKESARSLGQEYDDELVLNSIKRTAEIAYDRIESFLPDNTVKLPDFVVPEDMTEDEALEKYAADGLRTVMKQMNASKHQIKVYIDRLKQELEVISGRGFSKYFLTMKAISDISSDKQLVGPGRGSAAGSLIAYALGITQVDPIKYGLQFERFLTKQGKGYPDIDYDVSDPMEIKEHLIEEWGEDTVVPISNWNTLQLRSLIKDISKFYSIPFTEVNSVTSKMLVEATPAAKKKHGIKAGVYAPTWEEVMEFSTSLKSFLAKYPHIETHVKRLVGQIRSCSRHAGGVVIAEKLNESMPLIYSGGVRQTPWSEGQNVRHLEPMGFIKFDILGLASLRMIEGAIRHILQRHHNIAEPTFEDVQKFYNDNLHPDVVDLNDKSVYQNIFHKGKWAGIFQFTETGAQNFCVRAKPDNIIDLSAITSIFRPGPLSAKVDQHYVSARHNEDMIEYPCPEFEEVTKETYGFLIFQEQIAMLAHKLGKGISLDEGNMLRKVLTKKGTGKGAEVKNEIYNKFVTGCVEKNLSEREANKLWETFEYFSGYGFNKSHAVSYSILSFQCAWLLNYFPAEWMAAFLDKEPEKRKEKAVNIAKSFGFKIEPLNINTSGSVWEISDDGKTLIQPLTAIKGLGVTAIDQIQMHRPFRSVEELLFDDQIVYSKLNKKALDVLVRSQAMNCLMDDRFTGLKHFWSSVAVDRPKTKKKLRENIEMYAPEGDFSEMEKIEYQVNLTGVFPVSRVMSDDTYKKLEEYAIAPISEYVESGAHHQGGLCWFIPRKITSRKTKNDKDYWIVEVVDESGTANSIKCWGINPDLDHLHLNKPYMAKLDWSEAWGFSSRSFRRTFRLLS